MLEVYIYLVGKSDPIIYTIKCRDTGDVRDRIMANYRDGRKKYLVLQERHNTDIIVTKESIALLQFVVKDY